MDTPAARGFRLPAEWVRQEAVWLAWPRDPMTWPERLPQARKAMLEAMRHVTSHQRVDLLVHPGLVAEADRAVGDAGLQNVALHAVDHQDGWLRDTMPLYLLRDDGLPLAVKFRFNAWGGKYESLLRDDAIPAQLEAAGVLGAPMETAPLVLEGGSIDTDGMGTLLTTRQCLLHENRNPELDESGIEAALCDWLGISKVLWLGDGIDGDDTDGHVDDIARFVAPGKVVAAVQDDADHPDHDALAANREALESMTDARGRPLEVIDLPTPARVATDGGEALPASHANFLFTNGGVLMPAFGGASDDQARQSLEGVVDRPVIPVDCRDLVWGMGAIHCLSMQVPQHR